MLTSQMQRNRMGFYSHLKRIFSRLKRVFLPALVLAFILYVLIFLIIMITITIFAYPESLSEIPDLASDMFLRLVAVFPKFIIIVLAISLLPFFWSDKNMQNSKVSIHTDIAIEDNGWKAFNLDTICDEAVIAATAVLGFEENAELSIAFVDDARIQELNKQFRDKDKPTNVLSFPMEGIMLGDIVLARETIEREAKTQGKMFEHHLTHLIIHGFLHLLGYDHMDDESAVEMEAIEIEALAQLGIDNPYELNEPERMILIRTDEPKTDE